LGVTALSCEVEAVAPVPTPSWRSTPCVVVVVAHAMRGLLSGAAVLAATIQVVDSTCAGGYW
jgi:hypothetical protein